MKRKVGILSLGCPRNLVDSEGILGRLTGKGYQVTDISRAEVAILNTCAFVKDAKTEAIDAILELVELKKQGKLKKVIVCGCLVQRYGNDLRREFPEVDAFVGSPNLAEGIARYPLTPASHAYLKICEGCVNNCSFCAVPLIKARLESLGDKDVLAKLDALDASRVPEVNIIGQDLTGYGLDRGTKDGLEKLLSQILRRSRFTPRWFRLLYLHPARVTDSLLRLMASDPRVCRYIDLPLQHVNDRILTRMNRHTTKDGILSLIERVRKLLPGAAIRTAFIVGFPGETDKEFQELLSFIKETGFERLGVFTYSREEGTRAAGFKGQVPDKVKQERFDLIMSAQQEISRRHNAALMGTTLEVLIDEKEGGRYLGRSRFDAPEVDGSVFVTSRRPLKAGDIVTARVTDTLEYDLCAEVCHEHRE